jgi:hypothetical protein
MVEDLFTITGKTIDVIIKESGDTLFKIWTDVDVAFLREVPGIVNVNTNTYFKYLTFCIDPRYNVDIVLGNLQNYFDKISARKLSYSIKRYDYD